MAVLTFPYFQMMAVTVCGYLVAWGPFSVLCIWEMSVQPKVSVHLAVYSIQ